MYRHNGIRYGVKSMTSLTNSNPLKTQVKSRLCDVYNPTLYRKHNDIKGLDLKVIH